MKFKILKSITSVIVLASLVVLPRIAWSAVEAGNKICPVSGDKAGEMGEIVQVEHNGKKYNLCCKMCIKDFNKDPEKYIKKAEEEVKAPSNAK